MNLRRLAVTGVAASSLILTMTAASCQGTATGNGTVTNPTTTSSPAPVGGGAGTTTPAPTMTYEPTETVAPTTEPTTTAPTTAPTTTPVVVGVPQPGDEDFVELDCADFPLEQADGTLLSAQDVFNTNRLDIHGLDADGDGTACEDTDPAASQNDSVASDAVADSTDETDADAGDTAVSEDAAAVGITVDVQSY